MSRTVYLAIYGSSEFGPERIEVFSNPESAESWLAEECEPHPPWKYTDVVERELDKPGLGKHV